MVEFSSPYAEKCSTLSTSLPVSSMSQGAAHTPLFVTPAGCSTVCPHLPSVRIYRLVCWLSRQFAECYSISIISISEAQILKNMASTDPGGGLRCVMSAYALRPSGPLVWGVSGRILGSEVCRVHTQISQSSLSDPV